MSSVTYEGIKALSGTSYSVTVSHPDENGNAYCCLEWAPFEMNDVCACETPQAFVELLIDEGLGWFALELSRTKGSPLNGLVKLEDYTQVFLDAFLTRPQ